MKRYAQNMVFGTFIIAIGLACFAGTTNAANDVCSRGLAEPPFLSYGVDSNLLMLLDNSGSMLDMAYITTATQCFDDSYDPTTTYVGYFEEDSWYVWEPGLTPWDNNVVRPAGDPWVAPWENGVFYDKDIIVYANGGLYQALTVGGGTSNDTNVRDGYNINDDEGVEWEAVSQALTVAELPATCTDDELVSHNNIVYICKTNNWQRLEGGQFLKQDKVVALTACTSATGDKFYYTDEICVTIENVTIPPAPPLPELTVHKTMHAFAARGNLLNWASSSKFDIQKKILTGGKYDSSIQQLIGETRGCAGYGFVKQVPMTVAADGSTTYLAMRVRGATNNDRVGALPQATNTDDTTRIEVVGMSSSGFDQGACQIVIDKLTTNPDTLSQQQIDACLSGTNEVGTSQAALSTSVNVCRTLNDIANPLESDVPNLVTTVADKCESLFVNYGYSPSTMSPEDGGYVCYGIYDDSLTHTDRVGYLGRCWDIPALAGCNPKLEVDLAAGGCDRGLDPYCTYTDGGIYQIYKNQDGYNYKCLDVKGNAAVGYYCKTDTDPGDWELLYVDAFGNPCVTGTGDAAFGAWNPPWLDSNAPGDPELSCITRAMIDFCGDLKIPEVIDPSDLASNTTDYWNIPAMLIDGGVLGQLGLARPLATMKASIEQTIQPVGVLHDTVDVLRIGAMAFNSNGAASECGGATVPDSIIQHCPSDNMDGARVISPIKTGNLLIVDVNGNGSYDAADDQRHLDKLVVAINKVRATSWTPLAEAVYNAIGYYTQNTDVRIHNTDFQTDADVIGGWQNNYTYAPDSYILVGSDLYHTIEGGLSSGTSVTDDTAVEWTIQGEYQGDWNEAAATPYNPKDIVKAVDNKFYITYTGGTPMRKPGALIGSPLYDEGVLWDPLFDPIAHWCQDNNILIITEGASTADINANVESFVQGTHVFNNVQIIDGVETAPDDPALQCTDGLQGSTYLDDMTYFGLNPMLIEGDESSRPFTLYPTGYETLPGGDFPYALEYKKTITTYIVAAGALRDDGSTDECNPRQIMEDSALNGGTDLLRGEDPDKLEKSLRDIFNAFRQRASAGSAASVISSARGGEGAIYQAIFWPQLNRMDTNGDEFKVDWAGDVHGLYLDNRGFMYEDTDGDRQLRPFEDIDGDGKIDDEEAIGEDLDGDTHFDNVNEDLDGDGNLDINEDTIIVNGVLDPGEDVDGDGTLDTQKEDLDDDWYLDTGEDTNHNGILDPGEDFDQDGQLDLTEDLNGDGFFDPFVDLDGDGYRDVAEDVDYPGYTTGVIDGADKRVVIYYDMVLGRSMACYDTSIFNLGSCTSPGELYDVQYLWSATDWLRQVSEPNMLTSRWYNDPNLLQNRSPYISSAKQRFIFTWNDLDNNGIVDDTTISDTGELLALQPSVNWDGLTVAGTRGPVVNDFDLQNDTEVDNLIIWLRGQDWPFDEDPDNNGVVDAGEVGDIDPTDGPWPRKPLRSRLLPDTNAASGYATWRLGDIIHSTPMTVAAPAEGYHLIYNDFSYAQFLNKYKRRRHVVYFGANDGMLHAVNAGYYSEVDSKFCLVELDSDGKCTGSEAAAPELGAELWAYVPYNLQPHLKCLADTGYSHKYFVDQRPRIFDAQIFEEEAACKLAPDYHKASGCVHPNGWGTILVGGMRFGGTPMNADELNVVADDRLFSSAWFIMDITNPDQEPTLLGELSFKNDNSTVNLGYTTGMPTMIIMKEATETYWYLVFGSGPHDEYTLPYNLTPKDAVKGVSDQNARIAILPLDRLVTRSPVNNSVGNQIIQASTKDTLRIPAIDPLNPTVRVLDGDGAGTIPLDSPNGFVSDMITIDYDINPSYEEYKSDVIYFGTVEGSFNTRLDGRSFWDGGGKMYRLVTKDTTATVHPFIGVEGSPYGKGTTEVTSIPSAWTIKPLIDLTAAGQPITAAASVGTDGHNFWVYFGTGRFYDADDKTDDTQQSYYGIREPALIGQNSSGNTTRFFTWEQVERGWNNGDMPGDKGLIDVTDILVGQSSRITNAELYCENLALTDKSCLLSYPAVYNSPYLSTLDKFIGGNRIDTYDSSANKIAPLPSALPCTESGCTDGWVNDFDPTNPRERNVGQATLLGGLVTYTTYQPFNDVCQAEGNAFLYAQYYRTGTAWHKNIFGLPEGLTSNNQVRDKLDLGRGLATTPNLHVGAGEGSGDGGPKAFVQTSTGEILEIEQENLPIDNYRTGRSKWREYQP